MKRRLVNGTTKPLLGSTKTRLRSTKTATRRRSCDGFARKQQYRSESPNPRNPTRTAVRPIALLGRLKTCRPGKNKQPASPRGLSKVLTGATSTRRSFCAPGPSSFQFYPLPAVEKEGTSYE